MTLATARIPTTTGMQATAVKHAIVVTPATSNSKDDSYCMTAHERMNASNSRNESNNRTDNTWGRPAKEWMLAKVVKPATARRRPTTAGAP